MQEKTNQEQKALDAYEAMSAVVEHIGGRWGWGDARRYLIHVLPELAAQPDKLADAILLALSQHESKVLETARRYQLCPCARR